MKDQLNIPSLMVGLLVGACVVFYSETPSKPKIITVERPVEVPVERRHSKCGGCLTYEEEESRQMAIDEERPYVR